MRIGQLCVGHTAPVVPNSQLAFPSALGERDVHGAGSRVADDVGQRLLKDPEQRGLLLGVERCDLLVGAHVTPETGTRPERHGFPADGGR
jgi:hypothetical protein